MRASFESAILLAIGEFNYAPLVEASSPTAAAMFFYSFILIITIVVMQMVTAIVFRAYRSIRDKIDDTEEFLVMPTIWRKVLLGRAPSLAEQLTPLHKIVKLSFMNVIDFISSGKGYRWGRQVTPGYKEEGVKVTPETFSDEHLLHLFDSQNIFRHYGILSPKIEKFIKKVKSEVANERSVLKKINKDVSQSFGVPGSLQERLKERHLTEEMKDTWALDRVEFCALLKALDDEDSALHIDMNHNDEFRISKLVFSAYSRQQSKKKSTFKTRVEKKLAGVMRVLDAIEIRQQGKDDLEEEKEELAVKLLSAKEHKKEAAGETQNNDKLKPPRTRMNLVPLTDLRSSRSINIRNSTRSMSTSGSIREDEMEDSEMI